MPSLMEEARGGTAEKRPAEGKSGAPAAPAAPAFDAIHRGDCVALLESLPDGSIDLAFADPPYNIGFKYDEYEDNHADDAYLAWCERWIAQLHRVLTPTGAFWLAIGDEYAAELKVAAKRIGFSARNWVVWYYTFGQNCRRKFNRSHAHLFHFVKDHERHTFNAADPELRIPSARALVYGDRRANPTGRLPDDTWMLRPAAAQEGFVLRPQDLREDPAAFDPQDDTWYLSRVAGTFKERQGFHGCQMPEQLLGRIVRVSSNGGDVVLDPFAGSGTTLAVAKKLGRRWLGFELSRDYVKYASERIEAISPGDPLSGPADPVRSAPTTASGRRLKGHPMADAADRAAAVPFAAPAAPAGASLRDLTRAALVDSFHSASAGESLDRLLCDPDRQAAFHAACAAAGLLGDPHQWNREAVRLSIDGALGATPAAGDTPGRAAPDHRAGLAAETLAFAAEVGWARARGKREGASPVDLFCDPTRAAAFDRAAAKACPGGAAAEYRWAALRLWRESSALRAQSAQSNFLLDEHVEALAKARFTRLTLRAIADRAGAGGVYWLSAEKKPGRGATGYVGVSDDLGERLGTHSLHPLWSGDAWLVTLVDAALPSPTLRDALRWAVTHRLRPTLSIDLLAESSA